MRMRENAFSVAAWEKLVYERSTGDGSPQVLPAGSFTPQSWKLIPSVPNTCLSTSAPAPPSIE